MALNYTITPTRIYEDYRDDNMTSESWWVVEATVVVAGVAYDVELHQSDDIYNGDNSISVTHHDSGAELEHDRDLPGGLSQEQISDDLLDLLSTISDAAHAAAASAITSLVGRTISHEVWEFAEAEAD